ncbi:MAG: hypothetical protein A2020_12105 [Lentisphaerae bacterium GWF2_45_14]|nr:MAG: hypothetical protein A2020_12105 [Lentisphaerae bacterium GWF2_45_14]
MNIVEYLSGNQINAMTRADEAESGMVILKAVKSFRDKELDVALKLSAKSGSEAEAIKKLHTVNVLDWVLSLPEQARKYVKGE